MTPVRIELGVHLEGDGASLFVADDVATVAAFAIALVCTG